MLFDEMESGAYRCLPSTISVSIVLGLASWGMIQVRGPSYARRDATRRRIVDEEAAVTWRRKSAWNSEPRAAPVSQPQSARGIRVWRIALSSVPESRSDHRSTNPWHEPSPCEISRSSHTTRKRSFLHEFPQRVPSSNRTTNKRSIDQCNLLLSAPQVHLIECTASISFDARILSKADLRDFREASSIARGIYLEIAGFLSEY